ncbi:inositol 2-dehydrogenase [Vagococcus intermedius]|uniref:Inositol 2-dehydrogenase n=1 Tax=Vagococcus intermedius TaxID=2991418 RepID=A0AAF0CT29_9ENTE|nr:inositol 2-dehydrogenase [Vagococcus intermedius]WEG72408.1 inositol 2-dehydrogenase [Vagococcus intermedius]WEG74496.1 inositol 2-dehydrogenase [Vagococcus intermedius]
MSAIKLGIIGFGRIGKVHYENIKNNPAYDVTFICDINQEACSKESLPSSIDFVNDYTRVLSSDRVEAIMICTPTDLHPEIITAAAKAKKNIFCEKPIGFNMDEIMQAYTAVKENDVIFQLGFNRRFDEDFLAIHQTLKKVGDPHILKITSRDPEAPSMEYVKSSGGLFMDMAIHDFDMARYMMGEVTEVFVQGDALVNPDVANYNDIDTAIISLKFKNKALGVIDNSRQAVYGYDQRLEVFGNKGMLANANHTIANTVYSSDEGVVSEKPQYFFLERYQQSYATEMNYFANSIINGIPVACTIEDGIMAVKIAIAAKESFETGKPVAVYADLI